MSRLSVRNFLPGIAWFFIVLLLICLPGNELPEPDNWMKKIFFEKWLHAGMFGTLGFLFMWPGGKSNDTYTLKWQYCIRIALATSVWGLATEFIQKFFIPGRSFDLMDWVSDSLGILVAVIFARKYLL